MGSQDERVTREEEEEYEEGNEEESEEENEEESGDESEEEDEEEDEDGEDEGEEQGEAEENSAEEKEARQQDEEEEEGEYDEEAGDDQSEGGDKKRDVFRGITVDLNNKLSGFVMQFGAHREYAVPADVVEVRATENMPVEGGEEVGRLMFARTAKGWHNLRPEHVTLLKCKLKDEDKTVVAPFCCLNPSKQPDHETDDAIWLRAIPPKVLETMQPKWKESIRDKNEDYKPILRKYKAVLQWRAEDLDAPRLDPTKVGVGPRGFVELIEKLVSVRINPPKKDEPDKKTRGTAKKRKADALCSASDVGSETTTVSAKTIKIGPSASTHTFISDGVLYATLLA